MDSLSNLSLGTAALAIFALCAVYVMLRGIARVLIGTAVLGVSAWLAFLTWQAAPALSVDWFGKSFGLITTGLPVAVFVLTFVAIRLVLRWIRRPFGDETDELPEKSGASLFKVVVLLGIALIPTLILLAIGVGFVHHTASVQELRDFARQAREGSGPGRAPYLQTLKVSIEKTVPKDWLKTLDPLADPSRLRLAKWVTLQSKPQPEPEIDPATGKPIPRAIIVDDPALRELARQQKFGTLLRHPVITKALEDPKVRKLIADLEVTP